MPVVWPEDIQDRRDLLQKELARYVRLLLQLPNVTKVIAFGSSVSGETHETSDIDLLVVMKTDQRFFDRIDTLQDILNPVVAADMFVYTPAEYQQMLGWSDFVRSATETGQVLYDRE